MVAPFGVAGRSPSRRERGTPAAGRRLGTAHRCWTIKKIPMMVRIRNAPSSMPSSAARWDAHRSMPTTSPTTAPALAAVSIHTASLDSLDVALPIPVELSLDAPRNVDLVWLGVLILTPGVGVPPGPVCPAFPLRFRLGLSASGRVRPVG
jgi:hypothetical protein